MNREEMLKRRIVRDSETKQAANGYLDGVFGDGKHQDLYVRLFMAGARWADEHPCWKPKIVTERNIIETVGSACADDDDDFYETLHT